MNDKFRRSLERVVFKNKKTLLDYHRNIDRAAFDGFKFGLRERFSKLDYMIGKYEKGTLEFKPNCPIDLLKRQRSVMWEYLSILEQRARIEEIKL